MRLAKSSRTLLPLALSAVLAASVFAQDHPNVQPNAVRDQLMKQTPGNPQPQSAPPPQAPAVAKGPASTTSKAPANVTAKPTAKAPVDAKSAAKTPAKSPVEKPAPEKSALRRDPFDTLLTKASNSNTPPENLPPGKAGLVVGTLRINGIVRSPSGMIAVVANPQQRVYFLREGDKLYDGSVSKIALDGISFNEIGKDAFGKPLARVVTRRIYPSPGEQQ
jgi:Tfp pilus assembly protein PilP